MLRLAIGAFALGALAFPAAAGAQTVDESVYRLNEIAAEQQLARQRALDLRNEAGALQAEAETEARLNALRPVQPLAPPYARRGAEIFATAADVAYPSIPDATLAASRAQILNASAPPR